jgi:hypothetical protein
MEVAEDEVARTPPSMTAKQPPETDKKNEKVSLRAYNIIFKVLNKDSDL